MALEVTDANFAELIEQADKPVLLDFWAEWCGPCRMLGPVVDEIATEYASKAVVAKVNIDNNPTLASRYGIRSIPTVLFMLRGEVKDKQVGAAPKKSLTDKLDKLM